MITLHNNGVFLAGGVPAAAGPVSPEEGRKRTMAVSYTHLTLPTTPYV